MKTIYLKYGDSFKIKVFHLGDFIGIYELRLNKMESIIPAELSKKTIFLPGFDIYDEDGYLIGKTHLTELDYIKEIVNCLRK